ncbi:MAG: WD40 repeat domain-containing protein [Nocardioides sp.]|nr:WD40 repeat domain-containing protein [Nocardioides sp.]
MLDRVLGLASAASFLVGSLAGPAEPHATVDLTFADPAIVESSGLVVREGLFVTTNDSGDRGRIFVVDRSGQTVGTTSWAVEPEDVEALAPAGPGSVWVADIGDNGASRDSIEVLRVPYGRGDRTVEPPTYTMVYPDGAHDAEALLAHPRTGQLFVVTKNLFGGTLYAAPRQLSTERPNRLRAVADSLAFVTDGAFLPDGRHYLLRDYGAAAVYTFPGHDRVASFRLPSQQQGEGIAAAPDGSVHISTEGQFSKVLRVDLPADVERVLRPPPQEPSATPSPPAAGSQPGGDGGGDPWWPWLLGGAIVAGFVGLIARLLTRHGAAA